jgi:N utilization substance protein A
MGVKLETDDIMVVRVFEELTKVHVKDCLINEDSVYFLVEPGKMGQAIGKNGMKIKNVCKALGKNVKIFEYSETPEGMVKNLIPNANIIELTNEKVTVSIPSSERSTVIGRNGRNIKTIRKFLNRHFKIKNLRLK